MTSHRVRLAAKRSCCWLQNQRDKKFSQYLLQIKVFNRKLVDIQPDCVIHKVSMIRYTTSILTRFLLLIRPRVTSIIITLNQSLEVQSNLNSITSFRYSFSYLISGLKIPQFRRLYCILDTFSFSWCQLGVKRSCYLMR